MYLCMKYVFPNGRVGVIKGDQETARKCNTESLRLKRIYTLGGKARSVSSGIMPPGETCKGDKASSPNSKEIEY